MKWKVLYSNMIMFHDTIHRKYILKLILQKKVLILYVMRNTNDLKNYNGIINLHSSDNLRLPAKHQTCILYNGSTLVAGRSCKAWGTKSVLPQDSILKARSTLNFLAHSISSNCLLGHISSSYLMINYINLRFFFRLLYLRKNIINKIVFGNKQRRQQCLVWEWMQVESHRNW